MPCAVVFSPNRFTDLSLEINHLDFHISIFALQIGDHFFLNQNSGPIFLSGGKPITYCIYDALDTTSLPQPTWPRISPFLTLRFVSIGFSYKVQQMFRNFLHKTLLQKSLRFLGLGRLLYEYIVQLPPVPLVLFVTCQVASFTHLDRRFSMLDHVGVTSVESLTPRNLHFQLTLSRQGFELMTY